jgi:fructokinase
LKIRKPLIAGLGEILWDVLPDGKILGGAPANFIYHCNQLGAEAYLISAIGEDDAGNEIMLKLESLNQSTRYLDVVEQAPTSKVSVVLDSHGHPSYTIHQGVAWDHLQVRDNALELVSKADAICFGSLAQRSYTSRGTIHAYLSAAPSSCLRIFDINLRQDYYSPQIIHDSLEAADILKLNEDELIMLKKIYSLHGREEKQVSSLMEKHQLELVALTRGADGSTLYTRSGKSDYKMHPLHIEDTVGDGDSFTAALVVLYLRGMELDEIHRRASALAAFVCTQKGATPLIPGTFSSDI